MASLAESVEHIRAAGKRFYVYVLTRPSGEPFYVGKGSGDRIAKHELEAAKVCLDGHRLRVIRSILHAGGSIGYEIAGTFDSENEAFDKERDLISAIGRLDLGRGPLVNYTDGGEGASNPSAATIEKRAKKLKKLMQEPARKAAALAVLRQHSDCEVRKAKSASALRLPDARLSSSERMKDKWRTPDFREKAIAGLHKAQDMVWRANHAEGVSRVQRDPEFHRRRNEGRLSQASVQKIAEYMRRPETIARKSESAKAQRAASEAVRQRVLPMAKQLGCKLPRHTAGIETWKSIELALYAEGMI